MRFIGKGREVEDVTDEKGYVEKQRRCLGIIDVMKWSLKVTEKVEENVTDEKEGVEKRGDREI